MSVRAHAFSPSVAVGRLVDDLGVDDVLLVVAEPSAEPPAPASAAPSAVYIAAPSFWLVVATLSLAAVMASTSSPSSAFFSSATRLLDLGLGGRWPRRR